MTNVLKFRGLILSLLALGVVAAAIGGATIAFYGDVESSTGNTFTAGGIDLRVDSVSHYNGMICDGEFWQYEQPEQAQNPPDFPLVGTSCYGTWAETDIESGVHKFFNFFDLKPGDYGEDTISLHVYDNPAWGRLVLDNIIDRDNTCTESEQNAEDGQCSDPDGDGEIDNYLRITGWVDQGAISGFQCGVDGPDNAECSADPTEGDNIFQEGDEGPAFWNDELIGDIGPFDLAPVFATAYSLEGCSDVGQIDGDTEYTECHGYAEDGQMVPSTTYYFGLAWSLDLQETGNDAQTDTFGTDMTFEVEQHRNNPSPFQI